MKPREIPFGATEVPVPQSVEDAKRELLDLLRERTERIKKRQIDKYFTDDGITGRDNYRKHILFFNAGRDYKERAIFGGNRCKAPDSIINSVQGPRLIREVADGSVLDVHSWDGEKRCTAPASGWFLKGFEPMFRVVLGSGHSFACTAQHKLLGPDGQFHALASLLGSFCGVRLWGRGADYLANYALGGYRCGVESHWGTGNDPASTPSPTGAQTPRPVFSCADAVARTLPHSQLCLAADHRSNHGDLRPLADLFDLFSSRESPRAFQALHAKHQELRQLRLVTGARLLLGAAASYRRLSSPGCKVGPAPSGAAGTSAKPWAADLAAPQFLAGCSLVKLNAEFARGGARIPIFLAFDEGALLGGDTILAVIPVGWQPVLDCTVEGTHCYESSAGVIHHNTGKSLAGGYEATVHLTGYYPDWWTGKRFNRPVQGLACGKEAKITRDTVQQVLLGKSGEFGTGLIPGENMDQDKCTASRAASGLYDGVPVKHKSGGWSMLRLRSYDQGRTAFEGVERDFIWEDEEAPQDIHSENLMRTMTTGGIVYNTFTPLKGETALVADLLKRAKEGTVFTTNIWWDDVGHITQEMIDTMKSRYAKHELRARRFGEPQLGSGSIFTQDPDSYTMRANEMPPYWARLYGLDFGWDHPTAAIWLAHDRETDIVYVYSEHRRSQAEPSLHIAAIKARGDWITGISETGGTNAEDGKRMINMYKTGGCRLKKVVKGAGSLESSIMLIQDRLATGRLFVLETCPYLLEEMRRYHRDEKGAVVDKVDDLISALRYALTGLKEAKTEVESRGSISNDNIREINFFERQRWG